MFRRATVHPKIKLKKKAPTRDRKKDLGDWRKYLDKLDDLYSLFDRDTTGVSDPTRRLIDSPIRFNPPLED